MEAYIKYKRINKTIVEDEIQDVFDNFITEGWDIVHYQEQKVTHYENKPNTLKVTIILGKRQKNIL